MNHQPVFAVSRHLLGMVDDDINTLNEEARSPSRESPTVPPTLGLSRRSS